MRQNADKYGFTFDVYGTNADAIQAVLSGRADTNLAGHTVVDVGGEAESAVEPDITSRRASCGRCAFRIDDKAGPRPRSSMALKCMKKDGTVAKLSEKWFGKKPARRFVGRKIAPGHGVPDMPGYDPDPPS